MRWLPSPTLANDAEWPSHSFRTLTGRSALEAALKSELITTTVRYWSAEVRSTGILNSVCLQSRRIWISHHVIIAERVWRLRQTVSWSWKNIRIGNPKFYGLRRSPLTLRHPLRVPHQANKCRAVWCSSCIPPNLSHG